MAEKEGFFDLQVNGYGGIEFNRLELTGDDLHAAVVRLADDGVAGILLTIITDRIDRMAAMLSNVAALRGKDTLARQMIAGVHIEGPFINESPGYRGAHRREAVRPADVDDMNRLLDAADGLTRIVTLAPERDEGLKVTRMLAARGVTVSAGHCNPSLDQLLAAVDAGTTMFTHLGNGCPMEMHRHDNIIQRVLSLRERLWMTFIADGAHVDFPALGNYIRAAGLERCIVVTDAVAPAGLGPGRYNLLGRWDIEVGEDMVAWAPDRSHLVGSAITMTQSFANLLEKVGLSTQEAMRLTRENPRKAIALDN